MHKFIMGFSAVLLSSFSCLSVANSLPADKNLVNEWVQYKLTTQQATEEGEKIQQVALDAVTSNNPDGIQNFTTVLKYFTQKISQQYQTIQPKNDDMKALIALNEKNMQLVLKILPKHYQMMQSASDHTEGENKDAEDHFTEFMEASKVTAQLAEQEQKIERKVLQYLKENPL